MRPPAFVVLQELSPGHWEFVGEVQRRRGLSARAARSRAILDATGGRPQPGDAYAVVLASEWRIALEWDLPSDG